jgi:hypothetical protein
VDTAGPLVEITAVQPAEPDDEAILGYSLGRPVAGSSDGLYEGTFTFDLLGWVVGRQIPAARILAAQDGTPLWTADVEEPRPQVAEMFPGTPGADRAGFYACVSALALPHEFQLKVTAVLRDGDVRRLVRLATVCGRRAALAPAEHHFRPLMVTGFSRTGSNIFLRMLGEHPAVIAYRPFHSESRITHYWADVLRELVEPGGYRRQIRPYGVAGRGWWLGDRMPMPWPYHDAQVEHEVGGGALDELVALCRHRIESVCGRLATVCDRPQAVYLAEKHLPGHAPTMLWDLYPDAGEVFLVRDFRDMIASIAAANRKWGGTPRFGRDLASSDEAHVRQFEPWVTDMVASFARRRERAHLVRYEDLVRSPRETTAGVAAYLGIDDSPATLDRMVACLSHSDEISDRYRTAGTAEASIGRWKTDLQPAVAAACEDVFGPALEAFGYR